MSGNGISINIAADVDVNQVQNLGGELGKVADTLDQVAAAGDKAGEQIEQSLTEAGARTQTTARAFQDLAQAQTAASESVSRSSKQASDDAADIGKNTEEASDLGKAAFQNLGYATMSFDGSIQSVLENLASMAGFMAIDLPGALGLLAIAGGLGLSAIASGLGTGNQEAQIQQQLISDLTEQYIQLGSTGAEATSQTNKNLEDMAEKGETVGTTFSALSSGSKTLGLNLSDVAVAIASKNVPAIDQYLTVAKQRFAADQAQAKQDSITVANNKGTQKAAEEATQAADQDLSVTNQRIDAEKSFTEILSGQLGTASAATQNTKAYTQAKKDEEAQTKAQTAAANEQKAAEQAASDATKSFADSLHSSLATAGEDTSNFSITSQESLQQYAQSVSNAVAAVQSQASNLAAIAPSLTAVGLQYVEGLGTQAAPALAEAVKLGPDNPAYQALVNSWNAAGAAAGVEFGKGVTAGPPPKITPDVAPSSFDPSLDPASEAKFEQQLKNIKASVPVIPELDEAKYKQVEEQLGKAAETPVVPTLDPAKLKQTMEELGKKQETPVVPDLNMTQLDAMRKLIESGVSTNVSPKMVEPDYQALVKRLKAPQALNLGIDPKSIQQQLNRLNLSMNVTVNPRPGSKVN